MPDRVVAGNDGSSQLLQGINRQREEKCAASTDIDMHPNFTALAGDPLLADMQAQPQSFARLVAAGFK